MSAHELQRLLEGGTFFEGPRWHEGAWWVSDFYSGSVLRVNPEGHSAEAMRVENQPSGLGWLPDGSLLAVSMTDQRVLRRRPDGTVKVHADVSALCTGHLNDMVVDRLGRAWVGNFGFDLMAGDEPRSANLIRIDPDGAAEVVAEDLLFPNGSVITEDGTTLIVGETMGNRFTAFTIADGGALTDRRVWAQLGSTPALGSVDQVMGAIVVAPDGCCLDAAGHIWVADAVGSRCLRIAPGGEVVDHIEMPEGLGAFACMLGGPLGNTLLICAAPDFLEQNRRAAREAVLFTTEVSVPHAGRP